MNSFTRSTLPRSILIAFCLLPALFRPLAAQENSDCLTCHSDNSLAKKRGGRIVSLFVDEKKIGGSVHGKLPCIGCHQDLAGSEFPHKETLKKVECGECHSTEQKLHAASLHGRAVSRGDPLAPDCRTCHGTHEIVKVKDPKSPVQPFNIPFLCGRCHKEGSPVSRARNIPQTNILENYSESIHGEALMRKGLVVTATCVSCHTSHLILPHTDPRSSIARRNIASTCATCHTKIEEVHRKVIEGKLWEREVHVLPACPDCHQPHKVRKVFYDQGMSAADCLRCHESPTIRSSKDGRSLTVKQEELAASQHAKTACSQCHTEVTPSKTRACETIVNKVNCGSCHAEVGAQYVKSTHGAMFAKHDPNAPTCKECHGTHGVKGKRNPESPIFPINIPDLCGKCHMTGHKAAVRYTGPEKEIVEKYTESIHGKGLLKSGLVVTATCADCHSAHGELPHTDPASTVNRANVASTCGKCHHGIEEMFRSSVHSPLVTKTDKELPACSDCHSAHTIRRTDQDLFKLTIMNQCGRCHQEIAKTYFDTYHGKVTQLGYAKTAKCHDCHGAHDILPPDNPKSSLSRQNVVATCQKCHPGATRRFAGYLTHATHHDPRKYPFLFWSFWLMTALLVGVFVVGGLHTFLWLPRALKMRREFPHLPEREGARQYERFTRLHRGLHIIMIVSFISLATTGMTLKFSYTGWAVWTSHLLGGFESAGYIHRVAATFMIGIFIAHLVDVLARKQREKLKWKDLLTGSNTMVPVKRDWTDFVGSVKWFLGLGPRPQYGRWTYWEKFDYIAVFWGMFAIGSTGLFLWFPEFFTHLFPGWLINVATIIHSDEALLATGFIFTVHFFNTHLRPEKFPMDMVIFTGRMPVEELERDKPDEYKNMVESGQLEKHLVEPYQPIVTRAIRIFAWAALSIGFSLVLLIIYAMLFAYK